MIYPAPHHIPAAAFMGWPGIANDGPVERARAVVASAEANLRHAAGEYGMARRALGKANKLAAGIRTLHRTMTAKPLRMVGIARRNLLSAERALAAARVALDDATGTAPDLAMAA